ncbi:MAG: hypothetical protein P8Y69_15380 [Gammaproteobacteria bacterium]
MAVAFAGFASLVGILGHLSSRDDPVVHAARMRGMILFSLAAVAFSLLPSILSRFGLPEPTVWRTASLVFLLCLTMVAVWLVRTLRKMRGLSQNRPQVRRFIAPALLGGFVTAFAALITDTLLLAPAAAAALYALALFALLLLASLAFALILFSFLPRVDSQ